MPARGLYFFAAPILGFFLLVCPAIAQRHGGGIGGGIPGGSNRPTGVDEKDSLKDFHRALAVQATSQQIAEFQAMLKSTESAQAALRALLQPHVESGAASSPNHEALDKALQTARDENKAFQAGFSTAQKSGLKDIIKRVSKSESELEQQERRLDQNIDGHAAKSEIAANGDGLDKALTEFHVQQLALGQEMSIVLASGQDQAFTLPEVKTPVSIENRTVAVTVTGGLSQIATQGGQRTFKLELLADLSDLQQNITELLRAQLNASPACGQRVAIRQAALTPATPASLLVVQLHFERWTCTHTYGQQSSNELGEGDGTVEIKLTPTVEKQDTLKVVAAFGRIDATGMMSEALRSGDLGEDLRDKAAQLLLVAGRAGTDFKIALPLAVQNSATIQTAKFQDANVGGLSLLLEGQVEISNEQATELANQLNQALSAQSATSPSGTVPQLSKRPQ